uniref:Microtubule associated protein 10 n=1 Tax=Gasterosteus aculeatus aculeatus TaxID=481459 RepID=A0AAQ4QTC3_GASAC|nr:microtubule-associated protein 10 [Gasterosteus aculeatus aculeatus]
MSGPTTEYPETLFSFEFLVEYIRVDKEIQISDELALGLRLLDFPTLLIYQPQRIGGGIKDQQGECAFNKGKSCFFKMNLDSLHTNLSDIPLYVMVLDVKEDVPKLVGTSLVSLAKVMERIIRDVNEHGVSSPSSHGEKGVVGLCNLAGEKIGSISLSFKLLSLGASLLPHISKTGLKSPLLHPGLMVENIPEPLPPACGNICSAALDKSDVNINIPNEEPLVNKDKWDSGEPRREEMENNFDAELAIFCPPHLFYNNSAEVQKTKEGGDCELVNLPSDPFAFEDTYSEGESSENKIESTRSPVMDRRVRHKETKERNPETSEVSLDVLGEALRQLPLLNALVAELSQLNVQRAHQSSSIHPNGSLIHRPASTEPSARCGKEQDKLLQGSSTQCKHVRSPRDRCAPVVRSTTSVKVQNKREEALIESRSARKSTGRKLICGTTKTFNLRLQQISPLKVKRRECTDLVRKETQSRTARGKTESGHVFGKSGKRKSQSRALNPSSSLNEKVETMMQSIAAHSALHGTVTLKPGTLHGEVHVKQDRALPKISQTPSLSARHSRCIHIPSGNDDDVGQDKDEKEQRSKSNQVESQTEAERRREEIESPGSSTRSSPKSLFSDSSWEGNEEAAYADDFNSLGPSDAQSPEPTSSPDSSGARTPSPPITQGLGNSDRARFQRRAALPVPIKAPSSPQRSLRCTRIIRARTHASALSFSSDEGDRDGSASSQRACSRKTTTAESGRVDRSSGAEVCVSSAGQGSQSTRDSGPVRGFSGESVSSFDALEEDELEDGLGSLDLRKGYRHISELVANKLPGYTM